MVKKSIPIGFLQIILLLFGVCSFAAINSSIESANSQISLPRIERFINQFPIIRVFIAGGTAGNGHEASAATIIQRLRQFGYKGHIEAVSDPRYSKTTLKYPLVLPPNLDSDFEIISLEEAQKRETVPLAIKSADDDYMRPIGPKSINAQVLIGLKPMDFVRGQNYIKTSLDDFPDIISLNHLEHMGYLLAPPQPENWESFINENMQHDSELSTKAHGLIKIINLTKAGVDLLPFYGHGIYAASNQSNLRPISTHSLTSEDSSPSWQLQSIMQALEVAKIKRPELFSNRGTLIPVINDTSQEVIDDFIAFAKEHSNSVDILFIDDPNISEQLSQISSEKLTFVFTGPVSKPVFEYLYGQATLPPITQGRNSTNLMHVIGKPYLTSSNPSYREYYPFYSAYSEPVLSSELKRAYDLSLNASVILGEKTNLSEQDIALIAEFFIQSRQENSHVMQLFKHYQPQSLSEDKLAVSLNEAKKIISPDCLDVMTSPHPQTKKEL